MTLPHSGRVAGTHLVAVFVMGVFMAVPIPAVGHGASAPGQADISGTTTALDGQLRLPGVTIVITRSPDDEVVARTVSDGEGHYDLSIASSGTYTMTASLDGFNVVTKMLTPTPGDQIVINVEMTVAGLEEGVDVEAEAGTPLDLLDTPMLVETLEGELLDLVPVRGENFDALLPLLPGVVRDSKGRLSVKGGQATQTVLRVNSVNVSDPVTGEFGTTLPDDAIDTITLLPNPYAAEYGGFSAGVSEVATRRGTDEWAWSVTNFVPGLRFRDGTLQGIGKFRPRFSVSGPIVSGRIHLAQSVHYRVVKTKSPVRPETVNDTELESFDSFTQVDADLNDRHHLQATLSVFPRTIRQINVNTFNPREVTPNLDHVGYNIALAETAILSPTAFLETNFAFKRLDLDISSQGPAPMVLHPVENAGNFFNDQHRESRTFQLTHSLAMQRDGWGGNHLFKFGVDLMHANFTGASVSRPVEVRRTDGTLSQYITYGEATTQDVTSTDIGIFAQDRWRVSDRLLFELGGRVDRNGVLEGFNLSPRAGVVLSVRPDGSGVLRGGVGLFFPETTLNVKAFESYETPTVRWFDGSGTAVQRQTRFTHQLAAARTPSSTIWNIEYFHSFSNTLVSKVNFLRRTGNNELILHPVETAAGHVLQLRSDGRTRYWEVEWTSRVQMGRHDLNFTYVRSRAQGDLNIFDDFFGNFRNPIVRPNQFSVTDTDTAHRFLFRGTFGLDAWTVSPVFEGRQGFPFSAVDEDQNFVGARNQGGRFPHVWVLDFHIQRGLRIYGFNTRVGVRVFHLFESDFPQDVQSNIDAPTFGLFSNQVERSIGLTFRIDM